MRTKNILLFLAAAALLGGAGCATKQEQAKNSEPIKIGWVGPLSGEFSGPGTDALKAAQLAVEEVNANGGVNGQPLELIAEDGKCNPRDGLLAGNKLMTSDKVVALQTLCSGETTSIAPVAETNKVVLISNCASAPAVSQAGDYIFRTFPSDLYQGKFAASYAYNTLGKKKAATLTIITDYGTGLKNSFETNFKELGGEIVASEQFAQETRDLRAQITKIKNSGAEMVYLVAYTETYLSAFKQIKELGLAIPTFSPDSLDDSAVHKSAVAGGALFTVPNFETTSAWKEKMAARGANTSSCAPRSYDNVKLLAAVLAETGVNATKLKNALYQVKNFPGVGGPITFDANGDPEVATYAVMKIVNGKTEAVH